MSLSDMPVCQPRHGKFLNTSLPQRIYISATTLRVAEDLGSVISVEISRFVGGLLFSLLQSNETNQMLETGVGAQWICKGNHLYPLQDGRLFFAGALISCNCLIVITET